VPTSSRWWARPLNSWGGHGAVSVFQWLVPFNFRTFVCLCDFNSFLDMYYLYSLQVLYQFLDIYHLCLFADLCLRTCVIWIIWCVHLIVSWEFRECDNLYDVFIKMRTCMNWGQRPWLLLQVCVWFCDQGLTLSHTGLCSDHYRIPNVHLPVSVNHTGMRHSQWIIKHDHRSSRSGNATKSFVHS
jgi:hypothetical protein